MTAVADITRAALDLIAGILFWVALVAGCCVLAAVAVAFALALLLHWRARRHMPRTVPGAGRRDGCPWCGTHACLDSSLCNCEKPCGSWLCVVKETAS